MLPSFMRKPFLRRRYPMVKDHGTSVRNFTGTPVENMIYGSLQPGTGTEDVINRNGSEVVKTIWATPASDVQDDDIIVLPDGNYRVNGEPDDWETGVLDHKVVHLSRWKG